MGASRVRCQDSANPNVRSPREVATAGQQCACTRDTFDDPGPESQYRLRRTGSGRSSDDGIGSSPMPARSDSLDNVDGGPDAAFYIQMGVIKQVSIRRCLQRGSGAIPVT